MSEDLKTIATFMNGAFAQLAKSQLEEEGIEAYVQDENMGNILIGVLQSSTGGIRLQVKESDAELAQEILARIDATDETDKPGEPDETDKDSDESGEV